MVTMGHLYRDYLTYCGKKAKMDRANWLVE